MIKINVTEELIRAYRKSFKARPVLRGKGGLDDRTQDGLRAVLDIVERDLNEFIKHVGAEAPEDWCWSNDTSNCVEVND